MPNPFAHIELTTDNLKAAEKFYQKVFAWKLKPMPAMNYTMIDVGAGTGGGMQAKPMPDAPTGWMPYVEVDDVKQCVAKASKAGAQIMLEYQDIGDMGAIGVFRDPTGAVIGVWSTNKDPAAAAPAAKSTAKKATKKTSAKKASPKKAAAKKAPAKKKASKKR